MARDHLLRALLPEHDLRVLVCDATATAQHAATIQGCWRTAAQVFGQTIVGALLAAGLLKGQQRVTLQLAGAGPMQGLFVDASADGAVRGYVRQPAVDFLGEAPDLTAVVGPQGYLSVLRELSNGEFYRAAVPLDAPRLDRNLEQYYESSEQLPTAIAVDVRTDDQGKIVRAVGVLVQRLPGGDTEAVEKVRERIHAGVGPAEEEGGAKPALPLVEGLGELEVLEDVPVAYRCTCSRERAERGLASAGVDQLLDMVARDKGAEVSCEFCKTVYHFDAEDLLRLIDEIRPQEEGDEGEGGDEGGGKSE